MDFKEFGKAISKLRKEQDISQNELCKDIGISRSLSDTFPQFTKNTTTSAQKYIFHKLALKNE